MIRMDEKKKPLTFADFLLLVKQTKKRWCIRRSATRTRGGFCPIIAVARHLKVVDTRLTNGDWQLAATRIKLPIRIAERIIAAADGSDIPTRKQLLSACGLKEQTR